MSCFLWTMTEERGSLKDAWVEYDVHYMLDFHVGRVNGLAVRRQEAQQQWIFGQHRESVFLQ